MPFFLLKNYLLFVIMSAWSADKQSFVTEKDFSTNSVVVTQSEFRKHFKVANKEDILSHKVLKTCVQHA